MEIRRACLATLAMVALCVPAHANGNGAGQGGAFAGSVNGIYLGIGGRVKPAYPGASKTILSPYPIIEIDRDPSSNPVGLYPSFSFVGGREASDSPVLTGTNTIDWAFEAGLGVRYQQEGFKAFIHARQGFNGHDGQVATAGFDLTADVSDQFSVSIGPRVNWASDSYMDTYFGVTAAEAAAPGSVLAAYNPDSGIYSAGIEVKASYDLTDRVRLHGRAGWERYLGDAADSPIVRLGDTDQFTLGGGISYRFDGSRLR